MALQRSVTRKKAIWDGESAVSGARFRLADTGRVAIWSLEVFDCVFRQRYSKAYVSLDNSFRVQEL